MYYNFQPNNYQPTGYSGQDPSLGRYVPPMMENGNPNNWMNSGGYSYNVPQAYTGGYGNSPFMSYLSQMNNPFTNTPYSQDYARQNAAGQQQQGGDFMSYLQQLFGGGHGGGFGPARLGGMAAQLQSRMPTVNANQYKPAELGRDMARDNSMERQGIGRNNRVFPDMRRDNRMQITPNPWTDYTQGPTNVPMNNGNAPQMGGSYGVWGWGG